MEVSMTVNGTTYTNDVEPRTLLVHYLRENLRLTGTHVGCDTSSCGACTIIVNGETVKSTSELEAAFKRAKNSDKTYVLVIETHGYEWLDGTAFWESPTLENATTENNKKALEEHKIGKNSQRKGI